MDTERSLEFPFYACFQQVIREEDLETRDEWISRQPVQPLDPERYGYLEFTRIWKQSKKPDGMLVFSDTVARGIITSVLQFGIDVVPARMKFVIHRNAHMNLLCLFPVTWGISDEELLAKKLIQIIEKQFREEKVSPILLPYEMKADDASDLK